MRKQTTDSLAVDKEVAIVIHEHRDAELLLKHRSEPHPAPESGKVAKIANDAVRIVSRSGEGETDRKRWLRAECLHSVEAIHNVGEASL